MSIHEPTLRSPLDAAHDDYDGRPFLEQTLTLLRSVRGDDVAILDYVAIEGDSLGYSVLDFRQFLTVGSCTATFDCLATIIWKRTATGWREARWHASVISSVVPEGFGEQS